MLLVAGALAILIAVAHSVLGERYILVRLFRREGLPRLFGGTEFTQRTLRFAWHITSIAWCGLAGLLFLLARPQVPTRQDLAAAIAATFAATGLVALVGSRGRHLSWLVFFAIAALAYWG
jgi:hypothetical protein